MSKLNPKTKPKTIMKSILAELKHVHVQAFACPAQQSYILLLLNPSSVRKPSWIRRTGVDMDPIGGVASFRHTKEEMRTY